MFGQTEIIAKAWLVKEVVDLVLLKDGMWVDKIFLIGSYASGKQTMFSDLDFLVQLKSNNKWLTVVIPPWKKMREVTEQIGSNRIHIIYGTEEAAKSLHEKHKDDRKNYAYKEINLTGGYINELTYSSNIPSA